MKTFLLVATLVLAGCQSTGQRTMPAAPVDQQIDSQVDDLLASVGTQDRQSISGYAAQFKAAIEKEMRVGNGFSGKTCSVQIALERDGSITNTQAVSGDPALCEAILKAIRQANIPPAPDEKIYQRFKDARLDFAF